MPFALETGDGNGKAILKVSGDVVLDDAADLYARLRDLASRRDVSALDVDLADAGKLDSAGAMAATLGGRSFEQASKPYDLIGLSEQHTAALELAANADSTENAERASQPNTRTPSLLSRLPKAQTALQWVETVVDTMHSALRAVVRFERRRLGAVAEQTVVLGVDAWPIVALLSFLIGVILAFQGAFQLSKFGAEVYMAELVGLGMVREFAAMITAIILAGRSGAAIAAELGTMAVNEEIEALKAMGISPTRYLVFPRVAAMTVSGPLLTILSMAIGMAAAVSLGGLVGIPPGLALDRMQDAVTLDDFSLGLIKSLLFAWVIGFVGCIKGLSTRGGAQSVGQNTTSAVVTSIFLIIVVDSGVTTAWTLSHGTTGF